MFKKALRRSFGRDRSTERSNVDRAMLKSKPGSLHSDGSAQITPQGNSSEAAENEISSVPQKPSLGTARPVGSPKVSMSSVEVPIHASRKTAAQPASSGKGLSTPEKAMSALQVASDEFTKNFERFQAKHKQFVSLDDDISSAIVNADTVADPVLSALAFKQHISNVLAITERKAELSQAKWPNKVGSFLVSLYPVIRIAVGLGTTAAEVCALMEAER